MSLIESVSNIIDPVYQVGGSLRDELLGREPKDFDCSTPLTPEEITSKVKGAGRRAYLTGARFGTIGFKIDGQMIEVTSFRTEAYEPGSRKPHVEFVGDINR